MDSKTIMKVYGIPNATFYRVIKRLGLRPVAVWTDEEVQAILKEWKAGRTRAQNGGHRIYNHAVVIGFPPNGVVKNAGLTKADALHQVQQWKDKGYPCWMMTY